MQCRQLCSQIYSVWMQNKDTKVSPSSWSALCAPSTLLKTFFPLQELDDRQQTLNVLLLFPLFSRRELKFDDTKSKIYMLVLSEGEGMQQLVCNAAIIKRGTPSILHNITVCLQMVESMKPFMASEKETRTFKSFDFLEIMNTRHL